MPKADTTSGAKGTQTRDRIVDRAMDLVHMQGFGKTTLAQFAEAAEVPPGNFYYYFKTKESLGEALIEKRAAEYCAVFGELDNDPSPKNRLLSLIAAKRDQIDILVERGCPVGSLTQELAKKDGPLAGRAGAIFDMLLGWTARQFKEMGCGPGSPALAIQLLASLQGATLLANALDRPDPLLTEIERLSRWIIEFPANSEN